jgi:lipoyl(octanoyl) transferase
MMIRSAFLGRTEYSSCWELQRSLLEERRKGRIPDTLLFTEHDPVYTIGTGGTDDHLLASDDELKRRGIQVVRTDRGGDITYHGPGQLVAYPILDLHGYTLDLHRYLRDLEEVVIRILRSYGVEGERVPEYTGVWVAGEKICAIGIRSSGWVTMHGFALNVSTDLSYFDRIIPCGIFERGVTSLAAVTGGAFPLEEVARRAAEAFGGVFGRTVEEVPADSLTGVRTCSIS